MSLIHSQTYWFVRSEAGEETANAIYTYGPFNADVLNACQFFLKYTNAEDTEVKVRLSPADANGRDVFGLDPFDSPGNANLHEEIVALANGDNTAAGWFDPPAEMDRPFGSFTVIFTVDDIIQDCFFAMCLNSAAPG